MSNSLQPYSPLGSSVHVILQARILECVAMPSSGDLPDPEIEPLSQTSPTLAGRFFTTSSTFIQTLNCSIWDLVPWPGIEPGPPALRMKNLSHWTTREVPDEWQSHSVVSASLQPHGLELSKLLCPRISPGKNPGVGSHSFLQGIFPTQGSNPGLPYCRQFLYHLNHQGSTGKFLVIRKILLRRREGIGFLK